MKVENSFTESQRRKHHYQFGLVCCSSKLWRMSILVVFSPLLSTEVSSRKTLASNSGCLDLDHAQERSTWIRDPFSLLFGSGGSTHYKQEWENHSLVCRCCLRALRPRAPLRSASSLTIGWVWDVGGFTPVWPHRQAATAAAAIALRRRGVHTSRISN